MESAIVFQDEGFEHQVHVVELVLDLFGIDVLPVAAQDHGLGATPDVKGAVLVHGGHVARVEPSLGIEHAVGVLFVLEIALHHMLAPHDDLAGDPLRVGRIDPYLEHVPQVAAAGARLELVVGGEAD